MTDPVSVRAGWAIWGKLPGTREDYSVLSSSAAPLSAQEFDRVLARFAPGDPPAESGTPDSLPWVMLSRVGVDDKPYVGISVQDSAGYVDGTGRPVSQTWYVCVRYDDITSEPVSYRGLYEAISSVALPAEDGAQVPLSIRPLDPAALAREIKEEFGVEVVASTAALLLSGPVTITGPEFPDWHLRLRFLDAVAALLPYGYRAHCTASTWSDTAASAQRFRIVFARRAGDRSYGVQWRTAPQLTPGIAEKYYSFLRRTASPGGDVNDLAALIRYLSRQTAQCRFDQPEHAVRVIQEFRPTGTIGNDVNAGAANANEIRDVFRQNLDLGWPADTRRNALAVLIATADPQDENIIRTRLPPLGGEGARKLLPAIVKACSDLLWSGEGAPPAEYLKAYLESLRLPGLDDELLTALMTPPEQAPSDDRLDAAAALAADFAFGNRTSYPGTRKALTDNLALGTALIARLDATDEEAVAAAEATIWLAPDPAHVLRPFRTVLDLPARSAAAGHQEMHGSGDGGASDDAVSEHGPSDDGASAQGGGSSGVVSPEEVRDLAARGGPAAVRYLLRVASGRESLRLVLPSVAFWLCQESVSADGAVSGSEAASGERVADSRSWQDAAKGLTPANEEDAAWLDLVLLAARANPKSLFAGKYPALRFAHTLAAKWEELAETLECVRLGQFADELLTNALIVYLRQADWRASPANVAVERLTDLLNDRGQRPLLANEVWNAETTLRRMSPQATAEQIARACAEACLTDLGAERAAGELAQSGAITSGVRAAEVLGHVHLMIAGDPRVSSEEQWAKATRWVFRLAEVFADGRFGTLPAKEFAEATAWISVPGLRHHLDMLWLAIAYRTASAPPALDDIGISRLRDLHVKLGNLIENATPGGTPPSDHSRWPDWARRSTKDGGGRTR